MQGRTTRAARRTVAIAALISAAIAAPAARGDDAPPSSAQTEEIGLLFTQTAPSGTLKPVKGAPPERRTLTFRGVSPQVVWFSDRPARQSGHMPLGGFVSSWRGFGFADDPPNAALTVLDAAAHQDTVVLELGQPRYRAGRDRLRYPARILREAAGNLSHLEHGRDNKVPRNFGDASLFIDDASAPVFDGCVIQPGTSCPGAQIIGHVLWGAELAYAGFVSANLSQSAFDNANLSHALLYNATLEHTSFSGADTDLRYADFTKAKAMNAGFVGASVQHADFTDANLTQADFRYAFLYNATFTRADLTGANLRYSLLSLDQLRDAKLCNTTVPDNNPEYPYQTSIRNDDC